MAQSCRVCAHGDRPAIDAAILANRDSLRTIGAQYGVSKDSLARHSLAHIEQREPRQAAEPEQDGLPRQVSEPQTATTEHESTAARYNAFIERFRGGRTFSMTEVRDWGYSHEELEVFIETAIECGELSRCSEPRQRVEGGTIAPMPPA